MIYTTLNKLKLHHPCSTSKEKLLSHLGKTVGDDDPLSMELILDVLEIQDAIWCTRAFPEHRKTWAFFVIKCVKDISHLITDPRSIKALDIAEQFLNGEATQKQLDAAINEAEAAYVAYYTANAARAAAYAANAANYAAYAYATRAAANAYAYATRAAADAAIKKHQTIAFRALLHTLS